MKVVAVTKYIFDGKEYKSLKEIKDHIHNTIGEEFLDKMQRTCPLEKHKDYDTLLKLICEPSTRLLLLKMLNVTFTKDYIDEDGDECIEIINVLDV